MHLSYPSLYTRHYFRRTSATHIVNAGGSKKNLKLLGGWTIAETYVKESVLNKTKIAETILGENEAENVVVTYEILNFNRTNNE